MASDVKIKKLGICGPFVHARPYSYGEFSTADKCYILLLISDNLLKQAH